MDRTERFYRIKRLLQSRRIVTIDTFLEELEVSRATFKRDMEYLRSRLEVPIVWDRDAGGYRLDGSDPDAELPGLWFSAQEAHALLTMHHLLGSIDPGMLDDHLKPIGDRLEKLLGSHGHAASEVRRRIRLLHVARRPIHTSHFGTLAHALLERRRARIRHFNRGTSERLERDVSPQRLVYYRDNWYLDAWCHLRDGLRSFAVDAIETVELSEEVAVDVPDPVMDRELATGYGIFSGSSVRWAVLRFSAARARWVASEKWHRDQRSHFEADGRFVLEVPFSDTRELLMDILKHGPDVEVLSPPELRDEVFAQLRAACERYMRESGSSSEPERR
ncbi:MAG: WYL domain-containing protein [Betaproteobacteria bacterium]|nr:WYL domain-containing protein [Betaproteobacteria bacterium]